MKIKIMEQITKFCMAKGLKFSEQQIIIQSEMLLKRFTPQGITDALEELFFETNFFPDASLIAKKINQFANIADDKSMATQIANEIISDLHSNSFSSNYIFRKHGEDIFNAIGGIEALQSYGMGEIERGTFIAQMRDSIIPHVKKINHEILVMNNLAVSYNKTKLVDNNTSNKFLE